MYNVSVATNTWTQVHDGQSLANLYSTVALKLAQTNSPATCNTAYWPANTPIYLPIGQRATFVQAATTNGTVDVVKNLQ